MTYKRQGLKVIPDQGDEGSCTAFAMCNIINGYKDPKWREAGGEWDYLDGAMFFQLVNSKYPADLQGALTPPMALKYAKEVWYIAGYQALTANQQNAKTIKKLLKAGFLLLVVLTKVDRKETEMFWSLKRRSTAGGIAHSVCACSVDAGGNIRFVNSWGEERGLKGYFIADDDELDYCLSQVYVVIDSDDTDRMGQLLYKKKISEAVNILSNQWKYGSKKEQEAMNFANTMLRKLCLGQDHQWNMSKDQVLDFVNKNF